jgi:D-alanyl-D-alanine dipeptidase
MYDIDYQIPVIEREQLRASYFDMPLDCHAPLSDEPMVKLADYGIACQSYYARTDGNNPPYYQAIDGSDNNDWLRHSLALKLVAANQQLQPFGVELLILDAYRSIECQLGLWSFFCQQHQQKYPTATHAQCEQYAAGFVQDIKDFDRHRPNRCPAHMTGGSVDATLRRLDNGEQLDMGTRFEQHVRQSRTDFFERQLLEGLIDDNDIRLHNRRLMHWAFSRQGILNDPALFWHHDWGNQLWFKTSQALNGTPQSEAWYGYARPANQH